MEFDDTDTPIIVKSDWVDEDVDEVKDSWEDEFEEKVEVPSVPKAPTTKAKAKKGKTKSEIDEPQLTTEELAIENERKVRIEELSKLRQARALFGEDEKSLEHMCNNMETTEEFSEFIFRLTNSLSILHKSPKYIELADNVTSALCEHLKSFEIRNVINRLNLLIKHKLAAEKEKKKHASAAAALSSKVDVSQRSTHMKAADVFDDVVSKTSEGHVSLDNDDAEDDFM